MELGLKDRVALITGSSYGIGRGCAEGLAKEGAHVAICARNKDKLDQTVSEIQSQFGTKALGVVADCAKASDVENFVKQAVKTFGRVDISIIMPARGVTRRSRTLPMTDGNTTGISIP